ncbi:leucine-rich repeat domain-containing protein [Sediminimonas sp.]|uniref:leucine-rich repeat domain-containing protein n=1 Tax=Sediminimonas sp. TaxID=2823379 RepID=UPI0025EFFE2C|nr:leucine-rich repeat domain-containing protein [Sediminimonas sp.]
MSDAQKAYKAAEQMIAEARERGDDRLDFTGEDFRALDRLPPEIGTLDRLEWLDLARTQIADIAPLSGLGNLQTLFLAGTRVADTTPLQGLDKLQTLNLPGTQVADITPLKGLENLQTLSLTGTRVTDTSPLQGLKNLQGLDLDRTQVADIAPLQGLKNLQGLDLDRTQVADLRPIADLLELGDGPLGGLHFADTPAARATPELTRLSQIEHDKYRTRETQAYLKTLPPWPEPLPWGDTGKSPDSGGGVEARTAQAQIAFLLEHAAASQVSAKTTASQIRFALRDVPATDGNKLPPVLQTMLDVAQVLEGLATAPIGPDNPEREAELTARIAELEDKVRTLTAQLADAEAAREAAEALAGATGFLPSLQVAAGTSIGEQAGRLIHTGILSGTVYFLGSNHTFVQGLLRAIEALK